MGAQWQGSLFLLSVDSIGKQPLGEGEQQVEAGAEGHHLANNTFFPGNEMGGENSPRKNLSLIELV